MSTIPELKALKDRRHQRTLQSARYGYNADPSITTELENLDKVIHEMERIEIHRRRLSVLLKQADNFGGHVPAHILTEIETIRGTIQQLRATCERLGYRVASYPGDEEETIEYVPSQVLPVDEPLVYVRERLRDIEALIRMNLPNQALELVQQLQNYLR